MTMPMATGTSSCRNEVIVCGLVVLENVEIALVEVGDQMVLVVDHRRVHHHLFDLLLEDEHSVVARDCP